MTDALACKHGMLARACEICEDDRIIAELEAENARLRSQLSAAEQDARLHDAALREARQMALWLQKKYYADVEDFELLPDLLGVLSQINNMIAALPEDHHER